MKIKEYQRKVGTIQPGEFSPGRRAQSDDFPDTSYQARAGVEFGNALSSLGDALMKRQAQQEDFEVQKALAEESTGLDQWYESKNQEWNATEDRPVDGSGFADFIKSKITERQAETAKRFEGYSPRAQQALQIGMMKMYGGAISSAVRSAAAAHGAYMKTAVEDTIRKFDNSTALDPSKLDSNLEQAEAFISAVPLDPITKASLYSKVRRDLHSTALEGMYSKARASGDPAALEAVYREVESNPKWREHTDPNVLQRFVEKVDDGVVSARKARAANYLETVKGFIDNQERGNTPMDGDREITTAEIVANVSGLHMPLEDRERVLRKVYASQQFKEVYQALDEARISDIIEHPESFRKVLTELQDVMKLQGQVTANQDLVERTQKNVGTALGSVYEGSLDQFLEDTDKGNVSPDVARAFLEKMRKAFPESVIYGQKKTGELIKATSKFDIQEKIDSAPIDAVTGYIRDLDRQIEEAEKSPLPQYETSVDVALRLLETGVLKSGPRVEDGTAFNFTQYGGPSDIHANKYSRLGIGNRSNNLGERSIALSKELALKFGLKNGDAVYAVMPGGEEHYLGDFDDTAPEGTYNIDVYDKEDKLGKQTFRAQMRGAILVGKDHPQTNIPAMKFARDAAMKRLEAAVTSWEKDFEELTEIAKMTGVLYRVDEKLENAPVETFEALGKLNDLRKAYNSRTFAIMKIEESYNADPAGFLTRDQAVSSRFNAWKAAMTPDESGNTAPVQVAVSAFNEYIGALGSAASSRGLRPRTAIASPLTKEAIKDIVAGYDQVDPAQSSKAASVTLRFQMSTGGHWPVVAAQMRKEKLLDPVREFYSLADLSSPDLMGVAESIEAANLEPVGNLRARVSKEHEKGVTKDALQRLVREKTQGFMLTFRETAETPNISRTLFEGMTKAVLGRVANTDESPQEAADFLYEKIIGSNYAMGSEIAGSEPSAKFLRLPAKYGSPEVVSGLETTLKNMFVDDLRLPPSLIADNIGPDGKPKRSWGELQEDFRASLNEYHFWMLSDDEKSARLFDGSRFPVYTRGGEYVEVPFEDAVKAGVNLRNETDINILFGSP